MSGDNQVQGEVCATTSPFGLVSSAVEEHADGIAGQGDPLDGDPIDELGQNLLSPLQSSFATDGTLDNSDFLRAFINQPVCCPEDTLFWQRVDASADPLTNSFAAADAAMTGVRPDILDLGMGGSAPAPSTGAIATSQPLTSSTSGTSDRLGAVAAVSEGALAETQRKGSVNATGRKGCGGTVLSDERQRKLQEKNRRAQKRFREKQKARFNGMQGELEELTRRVAELQSENDRLTREKAEFEKAANERNGVGTDAVAALSVHEKEEQPAPVLYDQHYGGSLDPEKLHEVFEIQAAGRKYMVTAAMFQEVPDDALLEMWAQLVNEISDTLTHYELTTGCGKGAFEHHILPCLERSQPCNLEGGERGGGVGSSAAGPAALIEKLERLRGTYTTLIERGLTASPFRLRQLGLTSHFNPRAASYEQFKALHEHVASAMQLCAEDRQRTTDAYLRYRHRMAACTAHRMELFRQAGQPPPDSGLEWDGFENWVNAQVSLDDIRSCLIEENKVLVDLTRELFGEVWSPIHFARFLKSGRPRLADMTTVAHIIAAQEGRVPPLACDGPARAVPVLPFPAAAQADALPD